MIAIDRPLRPSLPIAPRSIAIGLVGAGALLGLYLGIISLAQGVEHALEQLAADALFVGLKIGRASCRERVLVQV